ncbi:MAG TPA: outer membrane lipoprotein-sorting protein [Rhizomicrobium sp.]
MKNLLTGFAVALLLVAGARAATAPTAPDIVAGVDKLRNPGQPFRITNTMIEYVGGKPRDRVTLVVFAKENKQTRQFSNLVRYIDPPRDLGKMVLMNGSNMWFHDPSSKVSVRISPQQRLMGQAANGDVMTANIAKDYTATLLGEETLQDADRKDRACWHLDLKAATDEAVYSRVEYWVEKGSYRPVKGKFYSDSGRLLKIAYYRKYVEQLGAMRASETIIIDSVDQNLVTTMTTSDMRAQDIPDAWFQREYLPRLKAD